MHTRHAKDDTFVSFDPLWNAVKRFTNRKGADEIGKGGLTLEEFAQMTGSTKSVVSKWKGSGQIGFHAADRAATALGVHPSKIWGDGWYHAHKDFGKCARLSNKFLFQGMKLPDTTSV